MLKRVLGINPQDTLQILDFHFRSNWPMWLLVALLLAGTGYALALYLREARLGAFSRGLLSVCRVGVLSIILFILFEPVLGVAVTSSTSPNVLVLVDGSSSMSIRDTRKDPAQLEDAALALGRLNFDQPQRQRAVHRAVVAMQDAAAALRSTRMNERRDAQQRASSELANVSAIFRDDGAASSGAVATPDGDLARNLDEIIKQQTALALEDLSTAHPDAFANLAATQQKLAQTLEKWNAATQESRLTLSEKLRAEMAQVSRHDLAVGMLTTHQPDSLNLVDQLEQKFAVQFYRFGATLEPLGLTPGGRKEALSALSASPEGTNLGGALKDALDAHSGQNIAGIVLISDGAANMGPNPLEAAQRMKERAIPLFTIGVGLPQPDDVYLRGLVAQDVVFANDLVPVRVQVVSNGYEKRMTTLSASLDGAEVASKQITLTGGPQFEELTFRASRTAGSRKLEVAVAPLPNEATEENNRIVRTLRVSDQKIKVLCIEGSPRWEYRYLRAVLKRDPRIEAQFITTEGDRELARNSKEHLARFPERPEQAFGYDLVIMGDVRATTFTPGQLARIEELVRERGGSFIMLAGRKHAPAEYIDTPIAQLLPVWPEQGKWEDVNKDAYPALTAEGQQSLVMQLDPLEAKNRALWANVKPLNQVPPLGGSKPGAQVLAELSDAQQRTAPTPLIVWQRYGAGKSMFVGTDRLWRLRTKTGDKYHARFWGQVIQFLTLSRLLGENQRIRLEVDRTEGRIGEAMQIYANVLNASFEPTTAPGWKVVLKYLDKDGADQILTLQPAPKLPGLFRGLFVPRFAGRYQLSALDEDKKIASSVEFTVSNAAAEKSNTAMQQDVLKNMADASGGQYLTVRDLPIVPDLLAANRRDVTVNREIELWDNWLFVALFVGLAGLEWSWRRSRDLA